MTAENDDALAWQHPNEHRFRAIIEHSWAMFAVLDAGIIARYVSPSTTHVFGYEPSEIVGHLGLEFIHPDDVDIVRNALDRARRAPGTSIVFEHRFRHRDGRWRVVETSATSLLENPAVRGIVVHSRDVTEQRELRAELLQAQLQVMRMQIHPHFLFNTLGTIQELIRENPDEAERTIVALATLLRLSFQSAGSPEVRLGRELELLGRYLEIQQLRFPDRLTVAIDVAPETRAAMVPNLMLQPLVENAIKHGFAPRIGAGRIEVHARREGNRLLLRVSDDGVGFGAGGQPTREGVGLSNTRTRLRQLYDAEARFELGSAPGGGAEIRIEIPFRVDERDRLPPIVAPARAVPATNTNTINGATGATGATGDKRGKNVPV